MSEETTDKTAIKLRNLKPFKSGKDWNGNALGRPKGSLSVIGSIKQMFEEHPDQFQEFIEKYLRDPRNRQHIVEMIDGKPKGSETNIAVGVAINQTPLTDEDRYPYALEVLARVHKLSIDEIKERLK
jgi:hypothetical protein